MFFTIFSIILVVATMVEAFRSLSVMRAEDGRQVDTVDFIVYVLGAPFLVIVCASLTLLEFMGLFSWDERE